jgi:hypothetical protein
VGHTWPSTRAILRGRRGTAAHSAHPGSLLFAAAAIIRPSKSLLRALAVQISPASAAEGKPFLDAVDDWIARQNGGSYTRQKAIIALATIALNLGKGRRGKPRS